MNNCLAGWYQQAMQRFTSQPTLASIQRVIFLKKGVVVLAMGVAICAAPLPSIGQSVVNSPLPFSQPALMIATPQNAVFLGLAQDGKRLVAVGEHGVIILSDDQGAHWRQVICPVGVTLTSVHFFAPGEGFVTGHFGVVLRSRDGGETWVRVLDGVSAAALAVTAAVPDSAAGVEARRLVAQGPDKPFFDSYFIDAQTGFVVGAYNLIYRTTDGGNHWAAWMSHIPNPGRLHLYAVAGRGGQIYVAGEQGLSLDSFDAGETFNPVSVNYSGSFFSAAVDDRGDAVIAGMEGHAFYLAAGSTVWAPITGLPSAGLVAASFDTNRTLWLANQAGLVFYSRYLGHAATMLPSPPGAPTPPFTSLLASGGNVFAGTIDGVRTVARDHPNTTAGTP